VPVRFSPVGSGQLLGRQERDVEERRHQGRGVALERSQLVWL